MSWKSFSLLFYYYYHYHYLYYYCCYLLLLLLLSLLLLYYFVWLQVKVVGAKYGMWGLRKYGTTLTNVDALLFWPDRLACLADQIKVEQRRALKLAVPSAFVTFKSAAVPSLCRVPPSSKRKEKFMHCSNHNGSLLRRQPRAVSPSYDVPCPHLKWACLCYALWSACLDSAVCCRATTCCALV